MEPISNKILPCQCKATVALCNTNTHVCNCACVPPWARGGAPAHVHGASSQPTCSQHLQHKGVLPCPWDTSAVVGIPCPSVPVPAGALAPRGVPWSVAVEWLRGFWGGRDTCCKPPRNCRSRQAFLRAWGPGLQRSVFQGFEQVGVAWFMPQSARCQGRRPGPCNVRLQ